jgi:hypothetical protein
MLCCLATPHGWWCFGSPTVIGTFLFDRITTQMSEQMHVTTKECGYRGREKQTEDLFVVSDLINPDGTMDEPCVSNKQ